VPDGEKLAVVEEKWGSEGRTQTEELWGQEEGIRERSKIKRLWKRKVSGRS
jgi:hypothetical protein